jgi:hypothetical protein
MSVVSQFMLEIDHSGVGAKYLYYMYTFVRRNPKAQFSPKSCDRNEVIHLNQDK